MKHTFITLLCSFLLLCGYDMSAQCTYTSSGPILPWPDNCNTCTKIGGVPAAVVICAGGSYTVNPVVGANATSWWMTGPGTITPPSGIPPVPPIVITPPAPPGGYLYTFFATAQGPNILIDPDFELGGGYFCSDYTQQPVIPNVLNADDYGVVTNGTDVWTPTFCTYPASYVPQSGNRFLIATGTANMNVVWEENVEVCPGQDYEFTGWIADLAFSCPGYPFTTPINLKVTVNGTPIVPTFSPPSLPWTMVTGTWSSGTATMADIKIEGMNPYVSAIGVDNLSFHRVCTTSVNMVIRTVPLALNGPTTACAGDIVNLAASVPGGTWSGSSPVATIDPVTGQVTTLTAGVVTFTYTAPGGCIATWTVTVNPAPTPITGPTDICLGSTVAMSSTPAGGIWTLTPGTGNGTITPGGSLTGTAVGDVTITYTLMPGGCFTTTTVNVWPNPHPLAVPPFVLCIGSTYLMSTGPVGGTWSSSDVTVATVTAGMPTVVTGTGPGTATISYTTFPSCTVTGVVSVQPCPGVGGGAIVMCPKSTTTLSDPVPGGTWSSSGPVGVSPIPGACVISVPSTPGTGTVTYSAPPYTWTWTITITAPPTACVMSFWDSFSSDYIYEFSGTPGATVTYCVEDYLGTPLGTLTTVIPAGGLIDIPYTVVASSYPSAYRVCICGVVDANGCPGYCGCTAPGSWPGCCAHVNPAGPKGAITSTANKDLHLNVAPNPTQHELTVSIGADDKHDETLKLEITDMTGKVILTTSDRMTEGEMTTVVTLPSGIANGVYVLKASGVSVKAVTKFVVSK